MNREIQCPHCGTWLPYDFDEIQSHVHSIHDSLEYSNFGNLLMSWQTIGMLSFREKSTEQQ